MAQSQQKTHNQPQTNQSNASQPQAQASSQQQQHHPPTQQCHNKKTTTSQASSSSSSNQVNLVPDQWVCVLCRKICHHRGLGDLYGPYSIDFSNQAQASHNQQQQLEAGPGQKAVSKQATPKKSKYSLLNHNYAVKQVWIHEDCLVWSEGVHLVGKKILKMDDTIRASFNHNCAICKTKGATIGCAGARCRRKFHYICGRDTNCLLDEANFTLKCDKCLANTAASLSLSINR